MEKLIIFSLLSIPIILLSWRSIFSFENHGFYRFFSWECILWMTVSNVPFWFDDPFSPKQIIAWILLFAAIYYLLAGGFMMKKFGRAKKDDSREALFQFEKTTDLIDSGIFGRIRHPLYGSLILLTWGIYLKNTTLPLLLISLFSTVLLYLTAKFDEKECIQYFGVKYTEYMKRTKMFVPFLF